jgi:glycerol-3-phosphate acyltransferase PlsY
MSGQLLLEMYVLGALITGLCWFQHRGNIRRLIAGNERKTYLGKRNHATLSEEDLEKIREEEKKEKDEKKYRK